MEEYLEHLAAILKRLREVTPRIVWATLTIVHPDRPFSEEAWAWRNDEIKVFNKASRDLMEREGVPINDLHQLMLDNFEEYLGIDQLHLSPAGQKACAEAVAKAVAAQLP